MHDHRLRAHRRLRALAALVCLSLASCATGPVELNPMPRPAASQRLRVFVQPLESGSTWRTPYAQYAALTLGRVSEVWHDTGIYEVVPPQEVDAVVGTSRRLLPWKADDYDLARRAAAALWAEYAMLVERSESGQQYYYETTLVSVASAAVFKVKMRVPGGSREDYQPIIRASYRQLFADARQDMLATARLRRESAAAPPAPARVAAAAAPPAVSRTLDLAAIERRAAAQSARVPVAVYDVDAREEDRLVARILSEALRTELVAGGRFQLVSREALDKILEELALQLSGLLDEKQAARVGQGLAVEQIVVGFYGSVGSLSVLQLKRIEVETQKTVGVGSLQCPTGKEEQLLLGMPGLAAAIAADG